MLLVTALSPRVANDSYEETKCLEKCSRVAVGLSQVGSGCCPILQTPYFVISSSIGSEMSIEKLIQTIRARSLGLLAAILYCALGAILSHAQTLTTLLDFDVTNGGNPVDLIQGFDGNLYGTTLFGGTQDAGTAFQFTSTGVLTILHSFCSKGIACLDGEVPAGELTQSRLGNFYGSTNNGGTNSLGVVFSVGRSGKFAVLYNFCSLPSCGDGEAPNGVIQARNGNLYGTAPAGGANYLGTVFELTQSGSLTVLHSFNGSDGANPASTLVQVSNANLYGTATQGGSSTNCSAGGVAGCGTIFEIMPSGTMTVLHSFDGADGEYPGYQGTMIQASDGFLYGTTNGGGSGKGSLCAYGCGTLFKVSLTGNFTKLYDFCSLANCSDGSLPSSLVQGTDGNFYGTTSGGGNSTGSGTIFRITPQGVLTTLYYFCSQADCADGASPQAALMQDTDGNFYGVTEGGGSQNWGTIYRFSMGLGPFAKLLQKSGKVGQSGGILGQGFTGTTSVLLNGTPARFTLVSDTYIQATVPVGATTGYVKVITPDGTLTSDVPFHVIP